MIMFSSDLIVGRLGQYTSIDDQDEKAMIFFSTSVAKNHASFSLHMLFFEKKIKSLAQF